RPPPPGIFQLPAEHRRLLGPDPYHRRIRLGVYPARRGTALLGLASPVLALGRRPASGPVDAPLGRGDPRLHRGGRGPGEGGTQSIAHGREPQTDPAGPALARE